MRFGTTWPRAFNLAHLQSASQPDSPQINLRENSLAATMGCRSCVSTLRPIT
jgi:hypothetical protein